MYVETFAEQRSPEWHHLRLGKVTGSRFAAAAGICPYTSPGKFYRSSIGEEPAFEGNVFTAWGTTFEPEAISKVEDVLGEFVTPAGFCISEKHPWLGVSPDGWLGDSYLEVKCPYSKELFEDIPYFYLPQIIGGMAITHKKSGVFACYIPDNAKNAETGRVPGLRVWRLDWSDATENYWKQMYQLMFESYIRILTRDKSSIDARRPRGTKELLREQMGESQVVSEIQRIV